MCEYISIIFHDSLHHHRHLYFTIIIIIIFWKIRVYCVQLYKKNPNYGEDIVLPFRIQKFALDTTGLESKNFYADCWPIVRYLLVDSSRTLQPYLCISDPPINCV
jgi:hypothetical protein